MGKWADGKALSTKSWGLLRENKYFLWFPIIGFLIAFIPFLIFGGVAVALALANNNVWAIVVAAVGLVFMNLAFTISGAALVAVVDQELDGRNSSIGHGFGKAFGRMGALFAWSLINAAISTLIGLLRGNSNGGAAVAGNVLAAIGAAAWSIVTLFVTPSIMLKGEGAVKSLKSSVSMVREKWGTQVTGGVRIGLRLLLITVPAIALVAGGIWLILSDSNTAIGSGIILFSIGIILFMVAAVLGSALRSIFSVALFRFTTGEETFGPFTAHELEGVLTKK